MNSTKPFTGPQPELTQAQVCINQCDFIEEAANDRSSEIHVGFAERVDGTSDL
ncbi:MAG: hypothetical protein ACJAR2_003548 [Ilumatobacter sp.]|jgi:hypothetical protein